MKTWCFYSIEFPTFSLEKVIYGKKIKYRVFLKKTKTRYQITREEYQYIIQHG